jgi:hypothetical protein
MQRVSTNLTLFYKLFLPTFWFAFFGSATIALFTLTGNATLQLTALGLFIGGLVLMYFTIFQFKRVEMGAEALYATNYFQHFQYPYSNVEKITHQNYFILRTATIHLRVPGTFGKKIVFVPSKTLYKDFWEAYPELRVELKR